ncbi:hypothetical protein [Paenibacillus tepidiphilus]|uniref:hypothetical protein n=1 Tax=Paenibacillus tepidiphilus TaxID=2608683 RepID=UPI0012394FF7|nr:hypothetical protein [Paenibacillus tepidiphilus]
MEQMPQEVFGAWQHSYEEDNGRMTVFRPAGYPFAAAREREQLEIKPDGTFVRTIPERGNSPVPIAGEWEQQEGARRIQYTYQSPEQTPPEQATGETTGSASHAVDIVECSADVLRLYKL